MSTDDKARLRFLKVEGAGNDFVLIDARGKAEDPPRRTVIRDLLDRHRGIGGDGFLWLHDDPAGSAASVRYWNADGGVAAYCGNGARSVARVLLSSTAGATLRFRFGRTLLHARASGARIALRTPAPRALPLPRKLPPIPAGTLLAGAAPAFYDAGVPHWIIPVLDVDAIDLARIAPAIRAWPALGREGTNVDLVSLAGRVVRVRTWERGVEGETLACGSGLLASAAWAVEQGRRLPISLSSRGGDRFRVSADADPAWLWLEGPARVVFRGEWPAIRANRSSNRGR